MVDDNDIVTTKHKRHNSNEEKDKLSWGDVIDTVLNIHGAVEAIKEKRKKKTNNHTRTNSDTHDNINNNTISLEEESGLNQ